VPFPVARLHLGAGFLLASTACGSGVPPSPATLPRVLGQGTVSVGNVYRGSLTPDGDTLYFFKNVTEGEEDYRIFRSHRTGSSWTEPERVALGGDHSDLYPAISPDGRRMVFSSYRPATGDTSAHPSAYLWQVEREKGSWGEPVFLAKLSEFAHYHSQPIFDRQGDLYFHRSGWDYRGHSEHVSRWQNGRYGAPDTSSAWLGLRERAGPGRHLYETTPGYDGSFTLLVIGEQPDSGRPGPPDLYVSFRSDTGWSAPRRLEGGVSTPLTENFAFYGRAGRELYFVRDFSHFYHLPLDQALGSPLPQ
jgi:WD40-like Beta Propeller Repeat